MGEEIVGVYIECIINVFGWYVAYYCVVRQCLCCITVRYKWITVDVFIKETSTPNLCNPLSEIYDTLP